MPTSKRLEDILRLAQRKNLLRLNIATDFSQTRINILPTIRRIIPFQDIADWTRHAERFLVNESGGTDTQDDTDEKPAN